MSKRLSLQDFYAERFNSDPHRILDFLNKEVIYLAEEGGVDWLSISDKIISENKKTNSDVSIRCAGWSCDVDIIFKIKQKDGIRFPFITFENDEQLVTFDAHKELLSLYKIETDIKADIAKESKTRELQKRQEIRRKKETAQRELYLHEHNAYELAFFRETKAKFNKEIKGHIKSTSVEFIEKESGSFDYLLKKQISDIAQTCDLKRMKDRSGEFVAIPQYDIDGNYCGLQRIYRDKKLNTVSATDGQFNSAFSVVGELLPNQKAYVAEGFATAATIWMATNIPVIVARTAGNLKNVITQFMRVYPDLTLINAADNDCWKPLAGNKGLMTAIEIHKEFNIRATFPSWDDLPPDDLETKPTDWNDLHVLCGLKAVSNMIKSRDSQIRSRSKYFDYCLQRLAYIGDQSSTNEALKAAGAGMMISPIVHSSKEVYELVIDAIPSECAFDHFKIKSRIKWIAMGKLDRAKGLRSFSNHELNKAHVNYIKVQAVPGEHNNMIIPPSVLDLVNSMTGSVIVRAPMGFGKTERLIKPLMQQSQRGAYIAHRVSLIGDASQRLGIANYQDTLAYEVAYTDHIACCVNSIINPKFQNVNGLSWFETVDTLCIDEASQVIRHTTGGPVDNPVRVMDGLINAMRTSNRVVLCDADANDSLIHLCELARPGETVHVIEVDGNCNDIEVFHTDPDTAFFNAVSIATDPSNPQKILIANDSAKDGERLVVAMQESGADLNILHVHKDSKSDSGVEAFLNDPNSECVKYDVVIYSPAISSGVSITTPHFDRHISIFHAVVAPSDAVQMMRRDRTAKKYMVGIGINNTQRETDRESIYRGLITADEFASADFVETEEEISLRRRKTPFDEMFLECQTLENTARNDFANNLILIMVSDGYQVKRLEIAGDEKDLGKIMKVSAGEQVNKRRIITVLSEETPDEDTFNRISRTEMMRTREEAAQIHRYHMEHQLCVDVIDEAVINFYDDQGIKKVQRLELLQSTDEQAKGYDHNQFKNKVTVTRHSYKRATREVLVTLFESLGIDTNTGEGEFTSQNCRDVMRHMLSDKERVNLYNSLKIGSYVNHKSLPKDATIFVKNIMAKFGLYVNKRKSHGRSVLSISPGSWEQVNGFVQNRLERGVHCLKIESHEQSLSVESKTMGKTPQATEHEAFERGTLAQGGVYTDVKYPPTKKLNVEKIGNIIQLAISETSMEFEEAVGMLGRSDFEDIERGELTINELKYYFRINTQKLG